MPTLKEQLIELTHLQHRLAIWEAVHKMLDDGFVAKETGRPAQKAIRVPECAIEVVPEETIEMILQEIGDGPISGLKARIAEIENQDVVVLSKEANRVKKQQAQPKQEAEGTKESPEGSQLSGGKDS